MREATARLAAAGLPPLGAEAPGEAHLKVRRRGDQARTRLAERRRTRPKPARSAPQPRPARPQTAPPGGRRLSGGQKRAGVGRIKAKIDQLQKQLAASPRTTAVATGSGKTSPSLAAS